MKTTEQARLHLSAAEREELIRQFAALVRAAAQPVTFEVSLGEGAALREGRPPWSIAASRPLQPGAGQRRVRREPGQS